MTVRVRHKLSAAVFIVLWRGPEVCLLRRNGTGWMDGFYSLPAGGLEANETIRSAARREAKEETGGEIAPESLTYAHTLHCLTDGGDWVGHFFTAIRWTGTPSIREPDKHSDLGWWSPGSLPPNTIPYIRQALHCINQGQPYSEYGWGVVPVHGS